MDPNMQSVSKSCVLMGDGSLLIECASLLIGRSHRIEAVITTDPRIRTWANERDIQLLEPFGDYTRGLSTIDYSWFFSIANLRKVPENVWRKASEGAVNFHDGPLPAYAGLNTPAWAILSREKDYAITWHYLTNGIDDGDIVLQEAVSISEEDTSFTLNTKCFEAGLVSFGRLIELIEAGTIAGSPQSFASRKVFNSYSRPRQASLIDFNAPTADLDRLGRALDFGEGYTNPLCLPKVRISGRAYNVIGFGKAATSARGAPGCVLALDDDGAVIATADGAVRIGRLTDASGQDVAIASLLTVGAALDPLASIDLEPVRDLAARLARNDAYFTSRLLGHAPVSLPDRKTAAPSAAVDWRDAPLTVPASLGADGRVAALVGTLARITGESGFRLSLVHDELAEAARSAAGLVAPTWPLGAEVDDRTTVEELCSAVARDVAELRRRGGMSGDLVNRLPSLKGQTCDVAIRLSATAAESVPVEHHAVTIMLPVDGTVGRLVFDGNRIASADAEALARRLTIAL